MRALIALALVCAALAAGCRDSNTNDNRNNNPARDAGGNNTPAPGGGGNTGNR